jgi:hypothetical protein
VVVDQDVIYSVLGWLKDSYGDLCGIEECERKIFGDVAHFEEGSSVVIEVCSLTGTMGDWALLMATVLGF